MFIIVLEKVLSAITSITIRMFGQPWTANEVFARLLVVFYAVWTAVQRIFDYFLQYTILTTENLGVYVLDSR